MIERANGNGRGGFVSINKKSLNNNLASLERKMAGKGIFSINKKTSLSSDIQKNSNYVSSNKNTIRNKSSIKNASMLLLVVLLASAPLASAAVITGFSQLRYHADFSVNASTLSLMTANTTRLYIVGTGGVGIGTSEPNYLLQVGSGSGGRAVNLSNILFVNGSSGIVGVGVENGTAYITIAGSTTSIPSIRILTGATPSSPRIGDIYSDGSDLFFYDGSSWVTLSAETTSAGGWTDSGNVVELTTVTDKVGIGTSSPSEKLYVSGNTTVTSDIYVGGNVVATGGSGATVYNAGWIDDGTLVRLATLTDRVGIGNLNANSTLHVSGNTTLGGELNVTGYRRNATFQGDVRIEGTLYGGSPLKVAQGINIVGAVTGQNALAVADTSGNTVLKITDEGKINFTTSAANVSFDENTLFIDSTNGNVGVGKVPVNGVAKFQINNSGSRSAMNVKQHAASEYTAIFDQAVTTTGNTVGIIDARAGGTSRFIVTTGGNVGINDTSPDATLEVVGNFMVSDTINDNGNFFIVNSAGNVGIGTTEPANTLQVNGNANISGNLLIEGAGTDNSVINANLRNSASQLILEAGSSVTIDIDDNSDTTDTAVFRVRANNGGTDIFEVNEGGNVGIGKTSPAATLGFGGTDAQISMDTTDGTDNAMLQIGSGGTLGTTRGGYINLIGNEYSSVGGGIQIFAGRGTGQGGNISIYTDAGSATEKIRIDSGGSVGIGTTNTSGARLTVRNVNSGDTGGIAIERWSGDGKCQLYIDSGCTLTGSTQLEAGDTFKLCAVCS
ncbi:hypothetical protein J4212_03200 [Candidatus Woesearchaeota archaeon]|nr:hypothetical protein [Candidatus Woesearchaeota archaeon]